MNKIAMACLSTILLSSQLTYAASSSDPNNSKTKRTLSSSDKEKYEIMQRDDIDNTDVYAIPYDESEIETEEQINEDEKKEVFKFPAHR